jgi:HK97 family phage major capsid protein
MHNDVKSHILGSKHFRMVKIDRSQVSKESESIPMTFSSSYPVVRWWGVEILSHEPESVLLERWKSGAPFLMDHNTTDQRGIIENGDMVNGVLKGEVRLSRNQSGQDLLNDITDGIRPYTSVGYEVKALEMIDPEEMDDETKKICLENHCDAYRITRWEPLEGSSVWLGANPGVGLGRDYNDGLEADEILTLLDKAKQERQVKHIPITIIERGNPMEPVQTPEQIAQFEAERVAGIEAISKKYEGRIAGGKSAMDQLVKDAVDLGRTAESFKGDIYLRINDGEPIETPASFLDLSSKQKREYSVLASLRSQVDGVGGNFERECSEEIAKRSNSEGSIVGMPKKGGLYVPYDVQRRGIDLGGLPSGFEARLARTLRSYGISTRDLSVGSLAGGGYLVGTDHRVQDFIGLLRNKLIQGITYLTGLSSNIEIPKQTGGATITVATSEGVDYDETAQVFGQVLLSPKDIGAYIEITRRLLIQSNPAIDNLVTMDLMAQMALKINYLALYGSGTNGQPLGIFNTPNIGTVDGQNINWPGILEFGSDIGTANVSGTLSWLCNSVTKSLLMSREKSPGYPVYLMNDNGSMAGSESQISEQMAAGDLAQVKTDEIVVAEFGIMEIVADRNSLSKSGGLRIACYHSVDSALKHPGAVSFADQVS